jgi:hypothetical protein
MKSGGARKWLARGTRQHLPSRVDQDHEDDTYTTFSFLRSNRIKSSYAAQTHAADSWSVWLWRLAMAHSKLSRPSMKLPASSVIELPFWTLSNTDPRSFANRPVMCEARTTR